MHYRDYTNIEMTVVLKNLYKWSEGKGALPCILCLSLMLKVSIALFTEVINSDGVLYISAAQQFASGHFREGLAIFPMPFYSMLIALVHCFVPHWVIAARFVSIAASVLVLIPLYFLARDLFDRRAAFWACFAFSLAPFPNECSAEVIRGSTFVFFFTWAVYFAQRAIQSTSLLSFSLAAFFSWVAILFRIEGIILFPLFFLFLACLTIMKSRKRAAYLKGALVWIAFPVLICSGVFVAMGPEAMTFNRAAEVFQRLQNLLNLRFLENYHRIYGQLKFMEYFSPYPGGRQNFAEIARHMMPVVYLWGLLWSFVKVLFPLFVVPLFFGLRGGSLTRVRVFVLALTGSYLIAVYYVLLEMDFIQNRFLLAPALLLYPWVGEGMDRLFMFLRESSKPAFFSVLFFIAFALVPIYRCTHWLSKQDGVITAAAEWIAGKDEFRQAKIITTDTRIPFYAGRERDYMGYENIHHNYIAMEQTAIESQMDLLIIRVSAKIRKYLPDLAVYKKIKEFTGKKNVAVIYCSPELHETLS
ncbi:MAG: glycosyltransferase family 39 protein [Thermodesulfobacteriota bacterium]|nr:glycosyltransferase family 39 protein [Thermodesulfobacteriota bacterium]